MSSELKRDVLFYWNVRLETQQWSPGVICLRQEVKTSKPVVFFFFSYFSRLTSPSYPHVFILLRRFLQIYHWKRIWTKAIIQ